MGSESWGVMDAGKHLLGQFDAPSYVRRGLEVEVAWLDVLAKLKRERKQWFEPLGRRLGEIKARAGDWRRLVGDNDRAVAALGQLETMLPCRLRFPPSRAWVILMHRREFKRWCRDAEQFNTYWRATAAAAKAAAAVDERIAAAAAELQRARAENEALKTKGPRGLSLRVSEKGGVSLYGVRRFPVTFYADEWEKILGMADEIRRFSEENAGKLKRK